MIPEADWLREAMLRALNGSEGPGEWPWWLRLSAISWYISFAEACVREAASFGMVLDGREVSFPYGGTAILFKMSARRGEEAGHFLTVTVEFC